MIPEISPVAFLASFVALLLVIAIITFVVGFVGGAGFYFAGFILESVG